MEWQSGISLQFLELYEGEPVIWDASHKDHKNRNDVHDAWSRIATAMGDRYTIAELKQKKNSLMASFRTYKKRVNQSKRSGSGLVDVYKPTWFAYDIMNQFLGSKDKAGFTCYTQV